VKATDDAVSQIARGLDEGICYFRGEEAGLPCGAFASFFVSKLGGSFFGKV
jgi:hypothetical protein